MVKFNKKDKEQTGTIEATNSWINKTKSGKGFIIYVKDDFVKGDIILGSMTALQEFIEGKRTGINLGQIVDEDEA